MPLRVVEVIVPEDSVFEVQQALKESHAFSQWCCDSDGGCKIVKALLDSDNVEMTLDLLNKRFSFDEDFRVIVYPLEATVPWPTPEQSEAAKKVVKRRGFGVLSRISREEVYHDVCDVTKLTWIFIAMVALSTVVAAVGLIRGNIAVVIGAMVIAPLLGPNVGFSLATTLGDIKLARTAVKTNLIGFVVALIPSIIIGLIPAVNTHAPEILSRTQVGLPDIALALAAGCAGCLAFTTGTSATLVGVMVAVAILPPLVAFGLLVGAAEWTLALGAFLLLVTNVICVNLAGVCTFLFQGIRPATWWEKEKASRATWIAISFWVVLLAVLAAVILIAQRN
ncbi:MAG: TIGR00341 family protein [Planctomycetota bacterium]|nr:MAG: TIGR00341 family protein [Planctomycetota bacterium]